MAAANSTYPKGGVSCSKDSFVVNQTLVFQINFCGKNPALRVAAKRYAQLIMREEIIDFSRHPKLNTFRKWVNGLRYFYFFQDTGTHGYGGQRFILPIIYSDRNDLIRVHFSFSLKPQFV